MAAKISAKRLANPALRSKIATKDLPPKYRAMRLANQRRAARNDPAALTQPLTPKTLDEQVSTQADLYAAPAERELAGQRAIHGAMMGAIPRWYSEYLDARKLSAEKTQQAYGAALGVQANAAQSGSALDAQQRAQQQQAMQADAAARGATVDPSIAAQGQQAAASRRAQADAQLGLTAGLGAAETTYRNDRVVDAAGQGIRAIEAEATRGRNLDASARDLAEQKGQFAAKTRQELIDREHTKQLENKAFGLDVAKTQQDAEEHAQDLDFKQREAARKQANEQARIDISRKQLQVAQQRANAYDRKLQASGKTKMSASMRARSVSTRDEIETANRRIQQLRKAQLPVKIKDKDGKWVNKLDDHGNVVRKPANLTWAQIREALELGKGGKAISHDAVNAALDLYGNGGDIKGKGYLSNANVKALQKRGVAVGALGYTTENGRARRRKTKVKSRPKVSGTLADLVTNPNAPKLKPRP